VGQPWCAQLPYIRGRCLSLEPRHVQTDRTLCDYGMAQPIASYLIVYTGFMQMPLSYVGVHCLTCLGDVVSQSACDSIASAALPCNLHFLSHTLQKLCCNMARTRNVTLSHLRSSRLLCGPGSTNTLTA
jgi:hypothetical protein